MRIDISNSKTFDKRIINTILNIISMLYIFIVPILMNLLISVLGFTILMKMLLLTLIGIFLGLNYIKYKSCNLTITRYYLDMLLSVIAIIYYCFFYQFVGGEGLTKIFILVYLLSPFILTNFEVSNVYYFGRKCLKNS